MKKIKGQKDLVNYSAKIALEFGSVARAILYSQIIYRRDIKQRSEFYKTDKDRVKELGLWLSEIKYAKKRLKDNWYIQTQHKRLDHSTSYIVDENQLNTLFIKMYWESVYISEHSQNWPSVKSELTIGKVKSDNRESQNWPSVKSELTFDIWTEITTDITTENNSVCNSNTPHSENSFDKIEFISKSRDAEKRWSLLIIKRNEITGRQDFLNKAIKDKIIATQNLPIEEFALRAQKFQALKNLVEEKKAESCFFWKFWERDLSQFLDRFNDFWGEEEAIIKKFTHFDKEKQAQRMLFSSSPVPPPSTPSAPKPLTEEEKAERKRKLEEIRRNLTNKINPNVQQ